MNVPPEFEVDYGTLGPEDTDRFGTREEIHVRQHYPTRPSLLLKMIDVAGMFRRLDLVIRGSARGGTSDHYTLSVGDRLLEIKQYAYDGRLELFLDGHAVLLEKVRYTGPRHARQREIWRDEVAAREQEEEMRQLHIEALRENARYDYDRLREEQNRKATAKPE